MANPYDSQYANIVERIQHYAAMYGIDPAIAVKQIWQESRFNPRVCSGANACGIAQFIPGTASRYGVDRNDIESSLDGWGRYMRDLLAMFGGRYDLALAGYNWGENRQELRNAYREGREIRTMPGETRNYLNVILGDDGINYGGGSATFGGGGSGNFELRTPNSELMLYALGFVLIYLLID